MSKGALQFRDKRHHRHARLLASYREVLKAEIAQTASNPEEIKEEFRHLARAFGR